LMMSWRVFTRISVCRYGAISLNSATVPPFQVPRKSIINCETVEQWHLKRSFMLFY
jgi:hypothetical protein